MAALEAATPCARIRGRKGIHAKNAEKKKLRALRVCA